MTKSQELRERYKVLKEKEEEEREEIKKQHKQRNMPTAKIVFEEILKKFDEELEKGNTDPIRLDLRRGGKWIKLNGKKIKVLNSDCKKVNLVFYDFKDGFAGFVDAFYEIIRENGDLNVKSTIDSFLYLSFRVSIRNI